MIVRELPSRPWVLPLSGVAGILLALCIGVVARLETGFPPGVVPRPYAHLLGRPVPPFELPSMNGTAVRSASMGQGKTWLLYFTQAGCGACEAAYESLRLATKEVPVLVVGVGSREILAEKLAQHRVEAVVGLDSARAVAAAYRVNAFPSALLVDGNGVVRDGEVGSRSLERVLTTWHRSTKGKPQ